MAHTPRGLQLGYILTPLSAHIVSYISKILQRLPSSLIRTVIRIATGQNEVCTTVSAQMAVNPALVWQVLGLGHEELQRVQQPDLLTLETFGRYIKCYWSRVHEDGWIAEDDIASIKAAIERGGGQAVRCIEGVKHDFCSSDEHSIYMAKICADWIEEDR